MLSSVKQTLQIEKVYRSRRFIHAQQSPDIHTELAEHWAIVFDAGPMFSQHNASCLLVVLLLSLYRISQVYSTSTDPFCQ